jgi:hypothetical protein
MAAIDPRLGLYVEFPDPTVQPLTERRVADLLAQALPPDAVREDRTLDPAVLREHGWSVSGPWIMGPPASPPSS